MRCKIINLYNPDRTKINYSNPLCFNCVKSEVWSMYTSVPKKSVERKCKWAIWTILRKKYHLCVKNRAIIVAKAVVWLPWYFWENMWLWCSSRLFPPIYRPCGKKWGIFLHLDILSNSWLLWMSNIFHNFKFWLRARKICGLSNFFWEIWPISGSHYTIFSVYSVLLAEMVFCFQNCSDLVWEKNVQMIEINF